MGLVSGKAVHSGNRLRVWLSSHNVRFLLGVGIFPASFLFLKLVCDNPNQKRRVSRIFARQVLFAPFFISVTPREQRQRAQGTSSARRLQTKSVGRVDGSKEKGCDLTAGVVEETSGRISVRSARSGSDGLTVQRRSFQSERVASARTRETFQRGFSSECAIRVRYEEKHKIE